MTDAPRSRLVDRLQQRRAPRLVFSEGLRAEAGRDPRLHDAMAKEAALFSARQHALNSELALIRTMTVPGAVNCASKEDGPSRRMIAGPVASGCASTTRQTFQCGFCHTRRRYEGGWRSSRPSGMPPVSSSTSGSATSATAVSRSHR